MLRALYQWILAKAAHPRAAWWLAGIAFVDGGLLPFPPHPLLMVMCLAAPRRALRYAAITTIASLLGGSLGYAIGYFLYRAVGAEMIAFLHLSASFPRAACYLRSYGPEIIMVKGLTPIPFMLLAITSGFIAFPYQTFILASLVSRGAIFAGIGGLFRVFGPSIKAFIDRYFVLVAGAGLVVIAAGYLAITLVSGGGHAIARACDHATVLPPR